MNWVNRCALWFCSTLHNLCGIVELARFIHHLFNELVNEWRKIAEVRLMLMRWKVEAFWCEKDAKFFDANSTRSFLMETVRKTSQSKKSLEASWCKYLNFQVIRKFSSRTRAVKNVFSENIGNGFEIMKKILYLLYEKFEAFSKAQLFWNASKMFSLWQRF